MDEKPQTNEKTKPDGAQTGPVSHIGRSFMAFGVCALLMVLVAIHDCYGKKQGEKANQHVRDAQLLVNNAKNAKPNALSSKALTDADEHLSAAQKELFNRNYKKAMEHAALATEVLNKMSNQR